MADWTCRCTAKNAGGDRYCEGCGAENPKAPVRSLAPVAKVAEGYAPWRDPVYPEPAAAPDVARKALAEILALVGRMGGEDIPPGSCPTHPGGCGRSRPAVRGPA